ncbi:unnamed protein product, partial [Thlaspi arvense]
YKAVLEDTPPCARQNASTNLTTSHQGPLTSATLTPGHDAVQKITGMTLFIPSYYPTLISKQQLFARIVGGLGGRAAEEVIFGEPEVTTGAVGNLKQITGLAKQMVTTFGMSEIRSWWLMDSSAQSDVIMKNSMSERLADEIDSAVKKLYEIALSDIKNNREAMDKLVKVLLEKETIRGDEFRTILSEYTEILPENRVPVSTTSTPTSTPTPSSVQK